jgi:hypothetical protein
MPGGPLWRLLVAETQHLARPAGASCAPIPTSDRYPPLRDGQSPGLPAGRGGGALVAGGEPAHQQKLVHVLDAGVLLEEPRHPATALSPLSTQTMRQGLFSA